MKYKGEDYKSINNYDVFRQELDNHEWVLEIANTISNILKKYSIGEFLNYKDFRFCMWTTYIPMFETSIKKPIIKMEVVEHNEKETPVNILPIGVSSKVLFDSKKGLKFIDIEDNSFTITSITVLELDTSYKHGVLKK